MRAIADLVTTTLLENGPRRWAYLFTNFSDGTGEVSVPKVDGSATGPLGVTIAGNTLYPGVHLKVTELRFQVTDMSLRMQWDANVDQDFVTLSPGADTLDYHKTGGVFIPPGLAGATGKILFTTVAQQVNSSYSVWILGTKGVQQ